jgi:Domain of unknown function (DUF4365)
MRASKTERTGMVGESEVEAEFRRLGWAAHKTAGGQDNGTDFLVSPRERRWELGFYLGVQVKSGPSGFERPKRQGGKVTGWWYIDDDGEELGGWATYPTQQIVVLHDLESRASYWEHVRPEAIRSTGKGDKLFVPVTQMLDSKSEEKLRAVAASFGTRGSLEGTWVEGYPISPPDRLRYALIAPRLLAPHPNFGTKKLTAEQAIAMLTQVRVGELFRYAEEQKQVPRGRKALESRNWTWRFFGAFWCRVFEGEDGPLRQVLDEAKKKRERAAVLGCLSAQMIGAARPQDALALLEVELDADRLGAVDHGWLAVQRARALAELGETETAREGARRLTGLRTAAPRDQTAIAISASAAALFANLSEPGVEIATKTMKATDVPTGWFRAQTVRSGLKELFERSFEQGMQDERNKWSREDIAHNRLLAGALEASHAADQVGWANITGMLGRNEALELERGDDPGEAADAIETLRLAGDVNALKLTVPHLCDDGPCRGVTAALKQIEPGSGTRTTGLAELVLIELGGDLADRATANRLGRWLLDAVADPAPFQTRTSPTYLLDVQLVSALIGVVGSAGIRVQQKAIRAAIETDDFGEYVLLERTWARLLADIPADAWTPGLADAAFAAVTEEEPGVFLADSAVLDRHKLGALRALIWGAGRLPKEPAKKLARLISSRIRLGSDSDEGDDADFLHLGAVVAASLGELREPDRWLAELLSGDRGRRRFGARLATKLARPQDIGTLGALMADPDPHRRAVAAAGLAEMLVDATPDTRPTIMAALEVGLEDPGRAVPRAIAVVLDEDDSPESFGSTADERLTSHPAASVRARAGR